MRTISLAALLAAAVLSAGVIPACKTSANARPTSDIGTGSAQPAAHAHSWARPIQKPGLPNLHQVSENVYRGAQPTAEGFRELKAMGVKTVIDLCNGEGDLGMIGDLNFNYVRIPMQPWHAEEEDVVLFLRVMSHQGQGPFFVHCYYGADRTGMVIATYRIALCGWTKDEAIAEMTDGGFGFHFIWQNLVHFVRDLDVDGMKRKAGLSFESHLVGTFVEILE